MPIPKEDAVRAMDDVKFKLGSLYIELDIDQLGPDIIEATQFWLDLAELSDLAEQLTARVIAEKDRLAKARS